MCELSRILFVPVRAVGRKCVASCVSKLSMQRAPRRISTIRPFSGVLMSSCNCPGKFIRAEPRCHMGTHPSSQGGRCPMSVTIFDDTMRSRGSVCVVIRYGGGGHASNHSRLRSCLHFSGTYLNI